jgi:hypothetical protein
MKYSVYQFGLVFGLIGFIGGLLDSVLHMVFTPDALSRLTFFERFLFWPAGIFFVFIFLFYGFKGTVFCSLS